MTSTSLLFSIANEQLLLSHYKLLHLAQVIKGLTDYTLEMLRNIHKDISPDRERVSVDKTTLDTAVSDLQGKTSYSKMTVLVL
jgi:hypothetical protein